MPATGSRGLTDPVIQITPGSITRSQQRQTGSIQTNLFSGTPDDPVVGFCRRVKEMAAELREQVEATRSGSEGEDDPVGEDEDDEDKEEDKEEEDKEEEEDSGYYNSGDDEEDDDLPPPSSHRPVTRSTLKKKPVSRPKRKAYRNQSGLRSSS